MAYSEIRQSTINDLITKVRSHNYGKYLLKTTIGKIRGFQGEEISFDFPVTALIGPNGSGKSAILGAAGCAYKPIKPGVFFPKSAVGDEAMQGWKAEYEIVDKSINARQTARRSSNFRQAKWVRGDLLDREVLFFGIERTVPAGEKTKFKKLMRSNYAHENPLIPITDQVAQQVEHILGKPFKGYNTTKFGASDTFLVGVSGESKFSEFHFGAGESSIIRIVTRIEQAPENSLILIEEIENGLHPVATKRMVEYLIDVANRKSIQAIFTTHSDHSLMPLPSEAIWACIGSKLRQGKLSVESLRAVSGKIEKKLAIFVEDAFGKLWVESILREKIGVALDQVEIHAVAGDGNAVNIHRAHRANPAIKTKSLAIIDGDPQQKDSVDDGIIRLPGKQPERTVFDSVAANAVTNLAILTVSCQRSPESQHIVASATKSISSTNRDPHLLFNQVGIEIGFVPQQIIEGAFLSIWVRENDGDASRIADLVQAALS